MGSATYLYFLELNDKFPLPPLPPGATISSCSCAPISHLEKKRPGMGKRMEKAKEQTKMGECQHASGRGVMVWMQFDDVFSGTAPVHPHRDQQ